MSWTIEYLENPQYARVNIAGSFNIDDHLSNIEALSLQEHWKPSLNILFDCTNADFSNSSYKDVRELADNFIRNDLFVGCGKVALLMKSAADFGRGRQLEMMTGDRICANVHIFLVEQEALDWLGT
jgi:hypothetical protein